MTVIALSSVAAGSATDIDQRAGATRTPCAELVEEFLAGCSSPTATNYRRELAHASAYLESRGSDLVGARRAELARYVAACEAAGVAAATIRLRLSALSSWYGYLVAEGAVTRSPVAGLRRPSGGGSPRLGLDAAALRRLCGAARDAGPDTELLTSLLLYCGLRVSEAVRLDAADCRSYDNALLLRVRRKGGREELVGVPEPVAALVTAAIARQGEGPLLRGQRGERLTRQVAWRRLRRLGCRAGIDDAVFPHLLRHSFVSQALLGGVALPVVAAGAGHRDIRSTLSYARALQALGAEAGAAVLTRVEDMSGGPLDGP